MWQIGCHVTDLVTWCHVTDDVTWHRKVKSWPQYVCGPLSRQWLEIETRLQWSTCRKWLPGVSNGHVTGDITYPERSRSLPRYISMQISPKRLRIEAWFQCDTIGNNILFVEWSCDRWCHVTLQGSCPQSVVPIILNTAADTCGVLTSRDTEGQVHPDIFA